MSGKMEIYRKEIFDFLRTVTIKYDPFAYLMGEDYMSRYGIENPHGEWNPYYLNLAGEYAPNDIRMTVHSLELETQISFDKLTLSEYPKTAALYRVPNLEFNTLCSQYPTNVGLIKSIVYPVGDIQAAIAAPNLSLLAYDDSLLHPNERESLITCLKKFLEMVRVRWYIEEFSYEDMYSSVFYAMLWQHLPTLLLAQRVMNLRTGQVHPLHIWEYLTSKGLGDYRDILTNNQSLWLYRNIDYILKNKGKNNNLIVLANNLLKEVFVTLTAKDMYQQTADRKELCQTTPEFISVNVSDGKYVKVESLPTLNAKLIQENLVHQNDADFLLEKTTELGYTNQNILPTKFLEFQKDPIDTRHKRFLTEFMLDTLMYRYTTDDLVYQCEVKDPSTNIKSKLHCGDAIALLFYSAFRCLNETPIYIPQRYRSRIAYQKTKPDSAYDIRKKVGFAGYMHPIGPYVDIDTVLKNITWHPLPFKTSKDFVDSLVDQYRASLFYNRMSSGSSHTILQRSLASIMDDILIQEDLQLHLTQEIDFPTWIRSTPAIETIVAGCESSGDPETSYTMLCDNLMAGLFPIDPSIFRELAGAVRNLEELYASLKKLFIQLCSYDITFLDTERGTVNYISSPVVSFYQESSDVERLERVAIVDNGTQFTEKVEVDDLKNELCQDTNIAHGTSSTSSETPVTVGIDIPESSTTTESLSYVVCQTRVVERSSSSTVRKTIQTGSMFKPLPY